MFPAVPLPSGGDVRIPVEAKLKPGWRYEARAQAFVSESDEMIRLADALPEGTRVVYKVPTVSRARKVQLSKAERDLQRYVQVIFPKGTDASAYIATIRGWSCMADVNVGPDVSLP